MKKNTFSSRLKNLFDQKQLSLVEVAQAINISAPSVHRWTRGGEIEYENLRALANYLEVNWIWLRYGDEAIEGLKDSINNGKSVAEERREYLSKIVESEARMNLAQDMARIATWEWNVLTNELRGSPNSELIFGLSIEKIRLSLLPFEALSLDALIEKFSDSELVLEWDFNLPQPDSEDDRWFATRGKLLYDAQHRPIKIIGASIDITLRKHMQRAMEKSEYIMRKVMETIPVGLWIADQNGKIAMANPEAERIWGGAKFVGLEHYGDYKGWWEGTGKEIGNEGWTLARAIKYGEVSRGETVNIEAFDGEQRTIIMSAIPLFDHENSIIGAIEVNQDITTLKQTEALLRVKEKKWNFIFEQSLIGIAYCKTSDGPLLGNAKFAELAKISIDELSNVKFENLLEENLSKEFQTRISNVQVGEEARFAIRGSLKRKTGTSVDVQLFVIYNLIANSVFKLLVFAFESNPKN